MELSVMDPGASTGPAAGAAGPARAGRVASCPRLRDGRVNFDRGGVKYHLGLGVGGGPMRKRRGGRVWCSVPPVGLATAVVVLAAALPANADGTAAASGFGAPRPVSQHAAPVARFGALRLASAGLGRAGQAMRERAGSGGHARGSVVLDGSPGAAAANPMTDTLYVPVQCRTSFCPGSGSPGRVVDVINTATCNAKVRSHCRVVARARVGSGPL